MIKAYRHGDLALIKIAKKPSGLKKSNTKTLLAVGSGGNPHTFNNGIFYPVIEQHEFIIGYLKAKNTKLFHAEHSPNGGKIENGLYEIRRQNEYTHEGMTPVVD